MLPIFTTFGNGKNTIKKAELPPMQSYLKYRPTWNQFFIFIAMAFGIFMVLAILGTLVLSRMTGISGLDMADSSHIDFSNPQLLVFIRGMLLVQFLGLFVIPVLLFAYFSDPSPLHYLGLKKFPTPFFLITGIVLMFIAFPLAGWLGILNQQVPVPETTYTWMKEMEEAANRQVEYMLGKNTFNELLLNLMFIAVFAGVGEELFFRGVLQRLFIRWFKNPWAGIIATAFIFSAIHFQFFGFFPRMMLGILLGAIYWYSGSLWTAIIAHFLYDGFIVVIAYYNFSAIKEDNPVAVPGANVTLQGIASLLLVIWLIRWMKKQSVTRFSNVYNDELKGNNPFSF